MDCSRRCLSEESIAKLERHLLLDLIADGRRRGCGEDHSRSMGGTQEHSPCAERAHGLVDDPLDELGRVQLVREVRLNAIQRRGQRAYGAVRVQILLESMQPCLSAQSLGESSFMTQSCRWRHGPSKVGGNRASPPISCGVACRGCKLLAGLLQAALPRQDLPRADVVLVLSP